MLVTFYICINWMKTNQYTVEQTVFQLVELFVLLSLHIRWNDL